MSTEANLRGILDADREQAVWLFDGDGTVLFANATALERVGLSAEETFGRSAGIFTPPEWRLPRLARIRLVLESGEPLQFEEECEGVHYRHTLRPVRDCAGNTASVACFSRELGPEGDAKAQLQVGEERLRVAKEAARIAGTVQEVTAAKLVEEELRERERSLAQRGAELETVLDSIDGAVYVQDAAGTLIRANSASRRLYGFDVAAEGGICNSCDRLGVRHLDGRKREHEECPSRRALTGESVSGALFLFRGPDGEDRIAEVSANPLRLEGAVAGAVTVVHDVTKRVRAEEQLRQSRELYRAIVSNLPDGGVVVVDRELRYILADGPLWDRMGWGCNGLVGRTVSQALSPHMARIAEPLFLRALQGETLTYETNYADLLVWANYQPLRDSNGEVTAVMVLCFDTTERRRVEENLKVAVEGYERQIRLFDGVASTTPDFVYLFDLQGRFLYANKRLLQVWGMELPDIIGKSCRELGYEQWHHDMHMREIAEVIETKRPIKGEVPFCAPLTRLFGIYEYIFTPVVGLDGEVELIAGTTREITERKRAEEQLRQSAIRLERIAHAIPDVLYLNDLQTLDTTYVSSSVSRVLGFTPEEIAAMGAELFNLVHPEDNAVGPLKFAALEDFPDGEVVETEFRMRHKDGSYRWIRARDVAFMRDAEGKLQQFLGVARDITEQKEAETALRLSEEALRKAHDELELRVVERTAELRSALEELHEKEHLLITQSRQAAMGEMIGNIAHQWRQPLNTLGLVLQRLGLLQQNGGCTREAVEETVSRSMQLIQHMSRTIDDFRNFFIPDKEKVHFRVRDAVADALKLMEGSLMSGGIAVRVEHEEDPSVYGYPSEYAQVLLNILTNAKDAFDTRPTPSPQVVITIGASANRSLVTVRDNAGGIPQDVLPKVFDPHFTTKGPHGTGIGLFMSKVIVEKNMNGRLDAGNVADGALFSIEV